MAEVQNARQQYAGESRPETIDPPASAAGLQHGHDTDRSCPGPTLDGAPQRLDAGDREVRVLLSMNCPRMVLFGDFLSLDECDALIQAARPRLRRSLAINADTGGEAPHEARTSDGMFFQRGETELIRRIEARISRLLNWPIDHGEGMQVLNYRTGAEYKPHFDYFLPAAAGTPFFLERGGQRLATFLMYLNAPEQGGGTVFPNLGMTVAAQPGHALFFSYEGPLEDTRTLHGGQPVIAGEKWLATKWLRESTHH
jgi:prolyl 4-hydroxylase